MQAMMCLCRAHVQLRLTKPILLCLISWWLASVRESSSWGSLRRRWRQDCAAGTQGESRCWGRGRRWEQVCLSSGSSELSCQICPAFLSWLLQTAVILSGRRSFMAIQYMQDSWRILWGFLLEGEKFWWGVKGNWEFFQHLYSTTTAPFTGLYHKYCIKSSHTAVNT